MADLSALRQVGSTFGIRGGILRLGYELQRASGLMSRRMRSVAGWDTWQLKNVAAHTSAEDFLRIRREGGRPFFFVDSRSLGAQLKKVLGVEGERSVIAEAHGILNGHLPFFGRLFFDSGFPPRWFQNPVTGQRVSPNRSWTRMRFASGDSAGGYGDLKFILEPSRFLFAYALARAYSLSANDCFPEAFWTAIEDWFAKSPPMSGPLWICGQESALRILAWSFALYAFLQSPATTPVRVAKLMSMIAAHAWRITQTVGYARSQRSNHLISEAVGLWTAGTLYPELSDALAWQQQGAQLLGEAVRDQITDDGEYLQDSFNYQRMILHQLLWTLRLAEIHKTELAPQIRERTRAAFNFIAGFVDRESGQVPNRGSNDGSNILPLAACDYGDFRPLLRLGGFALNLRTNLQAGRWDEPALWLCRDRRASQADSVCGGGLPTKNLRNSTGYYRLGTAHSWAMVRAGRYTRRPFQADQLHVDLWWRGFNLARDAGTYLYNGNPPWDNGLAGTAIHNTAMVDGRDQMRRVGRFLWLDWAQGSGRSFSANDSDYPDCFMGEHDGYRRMGVTHRRMVQAVTEDAWVVIDDLLGEREHELRLHWLVPDLRFEMIGDADRESAPRSAPVLLFSLALHSKNNRFRFHLFSSAPGMPAVVRGGKSLDLRDADLTHDHLKKEDFKTNDIKDRELLGWESPTYGELCPALSLLYRVQARLPVRYVTLILASENLQFRQGVGRLVLSLDAKPIHEVSLLPPQTEIPNA